jgi:quercetin dioxygenase-like cupin family protein
MAAPATANARAVASPMPEAAPVTSATLPLKSNGLLLTIKIVAESNFAIRVLSFFLAQLFAVILREMDIKKAGSQPSVKGPADWFTGNVRIDPLFQAPDPALVQGASVTFEPGARTAWHTHPLGQTLIITAGLGWVQREGGPIKEIRPGDVVWFEPGERHWHGASFVASSTYFLYRLGSAISPLDFGSATDFCNLHKSMFLGPPSMLQNLPVAKQSNLSASQDEPQTSKPITR